MLFGVSNLIGVMLINHSLAVEMLFLEKHSVTYLAVKKVYVRKGIQQLNFALNLNPFNSRRHAANVDVIAVVKKKCRRKSFEIFKKILFLKNANRNLRDSFVLFTSLLPKERKIHFWHKNNLVAKLISFGFTCE